MLQFIIKECDEETKKQLEYILDQLRSSDSSESSSISDDDEIVEEEIYLEEEIDQHDPVVARNDELSGFVLLEKFYSNKVSAVLQEVNRPETSDPDERPIRPQTGLVSQLGGCEENINKFRISTFCYFPSSSSPFSVLSLLLLSLSSWWKFQSVFRTPPQCCRQYCNNKNITNNSAGNTNRFKRKMRNLTVAWKRRSRGRGAKPNWRKTRRTSRNR